MRSGFLCLLAAMALLGCTKGGGGSARSLPPKAADGLGDFTLLDHKGVSHTLYRKTDARVVVIIAQGNDCPIIQKYAQTIRELVDKYGKEDVAFLMVNANPQDERQEIIDEDKEYRYGAPILMDPSQIVTRSLGMTRTSEAVIIEPGSWRVLYRGAIDDRLGYGMDKQVPKSNFLSDALDQVLAGKPITVKPFPAKGCLISFADHGQLSYVKQVAPILREKCLNCHSPGGLYPPFFNSYESVKGWAAMIRETIFTDRMPPSSYDPLYGRFLSQKPLTGEEKGILVSWLDAGLPRGTGADPLPLTPKPKPARKLPPKIWEVGQAVPNKIGPKGTVEYIYQQIGGPAPYDMWMTAFRTTTSNPRQLHHQSMMVVAQPLSVYEEMAKQKRRENAAKDFPDGDFPMWLLDAMKDLYIQGADDAFVRKGVWASGRAQPDFLPEGTAIFIPKGHYVVLEVHYVGNGKDDEEQTKIEFYGYRQKPKGVRQIHSNGLYRTDYEIPPNAKSFVVDMKPKRFRRPIDVQFMLAHMHVRGRSLKMKMIGPEGQEKTIVSIPDFEFSWHTGAELIPEKPIHVPKGWGLQLICEFDNSATNPNNPDPSKVVRFGQTFDRAEMCKLTFGYTYANAQD